MTVADLSHGWAFRIVGIGGQKPGRFFEVGFFVGQCGTLVRRVAQGHAFIVRIGQACIALRAREARCLQVQVDPPAVRPPESMSPAAVLPALSPVGETPAVVHSVAISSAVGSSGATPKIKASLSPALRLQRARASTALGLAQTKPVI